MTDYEKEIEELQEEIRNTQYNKATQHHIGLLKAKIAKLRDEKEKHEKKGGDTSGYAVRKAGDATVALLGFPSVGKSTLLNQLTNAESEVGSYEFTTLDVVPGMMEYQGANIQILDVPGLVQGASSGKGRGKEVLSVIRSADMVVIVVDAVNPGQEEKLLREVYDAGIRINEEPPLVKAVKEGHGGLTIGNTVPLTETDEETLKDIARELGFVNGHIVIREDITVDRFIDALKGNREYLPGITCYNKVDLVDDPPYGLKVSAEEGSGLDRLKEAIWEELDLIRVYMKEPGEDADMDEPLIVHEDDTIEDAIGKLHRSMRDRFKFARVSGPSAKFPDQKVSLDHTLRDEDVLELHLK